MRRERRSRAPRPARRGVHHRPREPRRRGLGKGERAEEARRLVPDLTVRHQRPELYVATHHAIARALDTVLPGARSHSVDELAAELAPSDEPEAILPGR